MSDTLQILQQGLQLERDGERYYEAAAEKANHPIAKRTFASLAEEERMHAQHLQTYYDHMVKEQAWPPPGTADLAPSTASGLARGIFKEAQEKMDAGMPVSDDLHELYVGAMELERKSIALYRGQLEQTEDPGEKEFFGALVALERGHLELLANTQHFLDDPASWNFDEEQWTVEG